MKKMMLLVIIILVISSIMSVSAANETYNETYNSTYNSNITISESDFVISPIINVTFQGATPIKNGLDAAKIERKAQRDVIKEQKKGINNGSLILETVTEQVLFLGLFPTGETTTKKNVKDKNNNRVQEEQKVTDRKVDEFELYVDPIVIPVNETAAAVINITPIESLPELPDITTIININETEENRNDWIDTKQSEKDNKEDATYIGTQIRPVMEGISYPHKWNKNTVIYNATENSTVTVETNITIYKARYDADTTTMWYWVNATRDGKEIAVDNPIWIYPAPAFATISVEPDNYNSNRINIILEENPRLATEQILGRVIDSKNLGVPIVGTKE